MQLREARQRRLLSIRGLADLAGVSPRTVVNIEQGHKQPTFQTARKISDALEISPSEIDEFVQIMGDEPWKGKHAA